MERSRKRKSTSKNGSSNSSTSSLCRRQSPRTTPDKRASKKPRLDSAGSSKSSLTPSRERIETYSTTRSGNFGSTSSSSDSDKKKRGSATSSTSCDNVKDVNNVVITSSSLSSSPPTSCVECDIGTSVEKGARRDLSAGEGCSTWTGNRPCSTRLRNKVHTSRYSSSTSSSGSNTTASGSDQASSSCSDTSTLRSSDITSTSCSSSSTSTNSENRNTGSCNSGQKRELKNLQDAWSATVSPYRTRSKGGDTPKRKTPRRKIRFAQEDSSSGCYAPSSSSTGSVSSDIVSEAEGGAQCEKKILSNDIQSLNESQDDTLSQRNNKQIASSSLTDELYVSSDTNISENGVLSTTNLASLEQINEKSKHLEVSAGKVYDDNAETSEYSSISSVEFPGTDKAEDKPNTRSPACNLRSLDRSRRVTRRSNQHFQTPTNHSLRSHRISDYPIASTSKADSCDCFSSSQDILPSDCDKGTAKWKGLETSNKQKTPCRVTRSRSKSNDKVEVNKTDEKSGSMKHNKTTFMTILTSEHDYFRRETRDEKVNEHSSPTIARQYSGEPGTNMNRTYTLHSADSDINSDTGYALPERGNADNNLSMARSDNALSCMPEKEESFLTNPLNNPFLSDSQAAVSSVLSPVNPNGGSTTSLSEDGQNLGFDLNDFVIRRRRLRSESTQDELWEGIPAVTPFRKQLNKTKSDARDIVHSYEDEEQEQGYGCSLADDSSNDLKPSYSSTSDIISEIDSILSDTQSSSCQQFFSDDVTHIFEEDVVEGQIVLTSPRFTSSAVQELLDQDLNDVSQESFVCCPYAKFSSETNDSSSVDVTEVDCEGHQIVPDVLKKQILDEHPSETPSDTSTTPLASRPESVWFSDKSEDWATPTNSPLKISPEERKNELEKRSEADCRKNIAKKFGSGAADVKETSKLERDLRTNSHHNQLRNAHEDLCSETSDSELFFHNFKVNESGNDAENNSNTSLSSDTTSSSEFLLWNKKSDRRKLSFPKIVLRKCKETREFTSVKSKGATDKCSKVKDRSSSIEESVKQGGDKRNGGRRKVRDSVSSSDESLTPKRSARLKKREVESSSQSRSTDFVYIPLKREDSKSRSTSHNSPQREGPSSKSKSQTPRISNLEEEEKNKPEEKGEEKIEAIQTETSLSSSEPSGDVSKQDTRDSRTRKRIIKKNRHRSSDERSWQDIYDSPVLNTRRKKGPVLDEELLTNPVVDKHACVLWSSEHRRHFQMTHPDANQSELDELLRQQWSNQLTAHEKMKYFTRARDALKDEDKHAPRSSRDPRRSGRGGRKMKDENDEASSLERFTRLKIKRQKDLLTKWLHFFQKVLSRREYAEFIEEVKQGILEAEARDKPNKSRGLTSKIFSHKKLLFRKMFKLKDHVMKQYFFRIRRQKELLTLAFDILIKRLIKGKPCAFIKGCRSPILTTILQDLKDLEYGDSVAVLGYPISTGSFTNLYKEIVETVDSCMFSDAASQMNTTDLDGVSEQSGVPDETYAVPSGSGVMAAQTSHSENVDTSAVNASHQQTTLDNKNAVSPSILPENRTYPDDWHDESINCEVANSLLAGLHDLPSLPVLHPSTLDAVFLPPPMWVPASNTQVPVTVRPIPGRSRPSVLNWRAPGNMYNFSPRGSRSGQMYRDLQRMPNVRFMMTNSQRMPVFNRPPDMYPQGPRVGSSHLSTSPYVHASQASVRMPRFYHQSVRDVLYSEAREAFRRSYASTSKSCCEMDSPSCVLSTWVAADKAQSSNQTD